MARQLELQNARVIRFKAVFITLLFYGAMFMAFAYLSTEDQSLQNILPEFMLEWFSAEEVDAEVAQKGLWANERG